MVFLGPCYSRQSDNAVSVEIATKLVAIGFFFIWGVGGGGREDMIVLVHYVIVKIIVFVHYVIIACQSYEVAFWKLRL